MTDSSPLRYRYITGMGHQLVDGKGKVHSTHDSREEAEDAHAAHHAMLEKEVTRLDKRLDKLEGMKEHEHPYWGKK